MQELAPVEYVVIGFPGNRFTGAIAPALADLVERRVVRILDLVFVKRDDDGTVTSFEFDQLDEVREFASIEGDAGELLSDEDVLELADTIPHGSSALFVVGEDLWAAELGRAVRDTGGELLVGGRLPHHIATELVASIEAEEVLS